jgi:hypothetical protein
MVKAANKPAYDRLLDDLRNNGRIVNDDGDNHAMAQCPGHDDSNPSLSITRIEGRVLIKCQAGCETETVVKALGRTFADLFDNRRSADYRYPDGRIVRRKPNKTFVQSGNTQGNSLFHADKLGDATTIYVVEGENDVLAIESVGGKAVCNAMGAGKARLFDWKPLTGMNVIIVADRDEPGRKHACDVANLLVGVAATMKIVEAQTGCKDAADHIVAGHSLDQFVDMVSPQHAPEYAVAEVIDGAELLDELLSTIKSYVIFADQRQPVAVVLWVAATYAISVLQHATRLVVTSPQKRCGKSRLLDIVAGLGHSSLLCVNATPAAVFRSIKRTEEQPPTLIVDEADALWGTKRNAENNEDLRALFNAGFQRNRPALRCVGPQQVPTEFPTFAMAAFAAIGRLPDTIMDRAIHIDLQRRATGETVAHFRIRRDGPKLTKLATRLAQWVAANIDTLAEAEPHLPVEDRAADAWEPLIAIADAAGGVWPKRARAACRALAKLAVESDDELGTVLLSDIRDIFADAQMPTGWAGTPFLRSQTLVNELRAMEESPWDEKDHVLTPSKLAKLLKPFGIKPGHNAAKTERGYPLESLRTAFSRYLRPEPSTRPTPDSDQGEYDDSDETPKCPLPVQPSVNLDGSGHPGRLPDTLPENGEAPNGTGQHHDSDDWTGRDDTPDRNGATVPQCECGAELLAPASIIRGYCEECRISKHN